MKRAEKKFSVTFFLFLKDLADTGKEKIHEDQTNSNNTPTNISIQHLSSPPPKPKPQPQARTDPVITKSYFDQNTLSEAKVKEIVASAIAANAGGGQPSGSNGGTGTSTAAATMKVVQLQNGQTLYAGAGAEFIVRTGRVLAVSNDENGIPDVTGGKDLASGDGSRAESSFDFPGGRPRY